MRDIKRVIVPLYGVPITFVAGFDAARKLGLEPMEYWGAMSARVGSDVYFALGDFRGLNPNTMAHEAVHCAWYILGLVGVTVKHNNHEALAYLVGWVHEQACSFFGKHYPPIAD